MDSVNVYLRFKTRDQSNSFQSKPSGALDVTSDTRTASYVFDGIIPPASSPSPSSPTSLEDANFAHIVTPSVKFVRDGKPAAFVLMGEPDSVDNTNTITTLFLQHLFEDIAHSWNGEQVAVQALCIGEDGGITDVLGVTPKQANSKNIPSFFVSDRGGVQFRNARLCLVESCEEATAKLNTSLQLKDPHRKSHLCILITLRNGSDGVPLGSCLIVDICGSDAQCTSRSVLQRSIRKELHPAQRTHGALSEALQEAYGGGSLCGTITSLKGDGATEGTHQICELAMEMRKVYSRPNEIIRRMSGSGVERFRRERSFKKEGNYTKMISEQFDLRTKNATLATRLEEMRLRLEREKRKAPHPPLSPGKSRRPSVTSDIDSNSPTSPIAHWDAAAELSTLTQQLQHSESQRAHTEAELVQSREEAAKLAAELQETKDLCAQHEAACRGYQEEAVQARKELSEALAVIRREPVVSAEAARIATLEAQSRTQQAYVIELERTLQRMEATTEKQLEEERRSCDAVREDLEGRVADMEALLKECGDELEETGAAHEAEVERLHNNIDALGSENAAEVDAARERARDAETQLHTATTEASLLRTEVAHLQAQLASIENISQSTSSELATTLATKEREMLTYRRTTMNTIRKLNEDLLTQTSRVSSLEAELSLWEKKKNGSPVHILFRNDRENM